VAREAIDGGWSVRMVEAAARGEDVAPAPAQYTEQTPKSSSTSEPAKPGTVKVKTADVRRVEDALRHKLGTDVKVSTRRGGRGYVTLAFYSNDDLARLLELMLGEAFAG
jgi:ParB family chromosome partitioning protein